MQKIISIILSIIMLIFSVFIPGVGNSENNMDTGEWLAAVVDEFGMNETPYSETPYYESVPADNEYFPVVQICYEWEIIDENDVIDVYADVDPEFVVKTLVLATKIESYEVRQVAKAETLKYANLIGAAAALGIIELKENGTFDAFEPTYDYCLKLLHIASDLWKSQAVEDEAATIVYSTDVKQNGEAVNKGDIFVGEDGKLYEAVKVANNGTAVKTEPVKLEDAVKSIDYAASFSPNMAAAEVVSGEGEVVQAGIANNEGIKETIDEVKDVLSDKEALKGAVKDLLVDTLSEGSFSVGGADVDYAFTEGGFNIGISGDVGNGINLAKSYSVSNLELLTKFDGSFKNGKANVQEGYLKLNYDCVDTTKVSASYAASLVSGLTEDISSLEVVDQIKMNFENLKLEQGKASFPVFTAHIAIPNAPMITIKMEASLVFNIYGYAELIITTDNCVGYEIIDNNGRFIFERTETAPKVFNAMGTAEALIGLNVALCAFGISLIDLGLEGGLGVYVYCTMTLPYADFTMTEIQDIPANVLAQSVAILDNADEITISGVADFYGVFRISLCENSITDKIGLSKTWTIVDHSNGTFATITF